MNAAPSKRPIVVPRFRPVINIRAGELHATASAAERALIDDGAPIFVRNGLVRPIVDDLPAAGGHRTRVARLTPLSIDGLIDRLSRAADWQKWDGRRKMEVSIDPPATVASIILAREGEWNFRPLAGVITTPTLRPDGTILSEPGYDKATRLLLLDPPRLPSIPDRPSRADALAALESLDALLEGFPIVGDPSRSVALSALITPVVRGAMPVAPVHVLSAPVAGSGKSYLIDLAAAILTGDRAPVMAAGRTEEETEKRLAAALLGGQALICIDNVNGYLGGDAICQAIERPVVSIRPLGVSKLVRIEARATFFANGNNIELVGDMTRRAVVCLLDPGMERPELRRFSDNPYETVLADRGKYVAAVLTIARAYRSAGYPEALPPLASFEDWSRVVRSALVWLGRADPCDTMEAVRAGDPVIVTLGALLQSWSETIGSGEYAAGRLKEVAEMRSANGAIANPALLAAFLEVADDRGLINARKLGRYLARHKGRVISGLRLVAREDSHSKQLRWSVKPP